MFLVLLLSGCAQQPEMAAPNLGQTIENPVKCSTISNDDNVIIIFNRLPENLFDINNVDRTKDTGKFVTAATLIAALKTWDLDEGQTCETMLKKLINSPSAPDAFTKSAKNFIDERMKQNNKAGYLANAYFDGATPENGYKVDDLKLTVYDVDYHEESQITGQKLNIEKVEFRFAGADSPRQISLYQDSDDNWYIWSDSYYSLLADIKVPN